ncbi:MAG: hypothetical protein AB7N10_07045 [Fimbriimonadaceae bacterium]
MLTLIALATMVSARNILRCDVRYEEYIGIACIQMQEGCPDPLGNCTRHFVPKYSCVPFGTGCTLAFGATVATKYTNPCTVNAAQICVCPATGGTMTTYIIMQDRC